MDISSFRESLNAEGPPMGLSDVTEALWWDAKGDWSRAHQLVDELETKEGMAVHAYLHRKEGEAWNANYWYARAGLDCYRENLDEEWQALVELLLAD